MYSAVVKYSFICPSINEDAPRAPALPEKVSQKVVEKVQKKKKAYVQEQYLQHKIETEILSYSTTTHHANLLRAGNDFRAVMSQSLEGSRVWMTGSFAAGVDTAKSDIDFTIKVPSWNEGSCLEKLTMVKEEVFDKSTLFEKVNVIKARTPVLQLVHVETGVEIDVTTDNDDAKRNTQLLSLYGQADKRFPILCKAVKSWAKPVGIEGAKQLRMNAFSICLLLIQYLQVVDVLPNLQELFPELTGDHVIADDNYKMENMEEKLKSKWAKYGKNKSSLTTLYLGFLKYYGSFDFSSRWISISHGRPQQKEFDADNLPLNGLPTANRFIVVADPYMADCNCSRSVPSAVFMERIQLEFQKAHLSILKRHTLFYHYPSPWRICLEKEGMEGDRRFPIWHREGLDARDAGKEEVEWGCYDAGSDDYWISAPEEFWELNRPKMIQYEKMERWPEPPMRVYFTDETLISEVLQEMVNSVIETMEI